MAYQDGAILVWFGRDQRNDAQYLEKWRDAPLTYSPGQETDENWNADRYEVILGTDQSGALFQRAARLTMNNLFYPPEVMSTVSDFGLVGRPAKPGDRVVQRICILQYRGLPILEALTMNEITQIIQETRRAGFTYTTTAAHAEIGEWSPVVEWRENGEVVLVISVVSRSRQGASRYTRQLSRRLQLRAHKLCIQNFRAMLYGVPYASPQPDTSTAVSLLPVAMLLTAMLLFFYTILGFSRNES